MKHNVLTQLTAKSALEGKYADGQGLWLIKTDRARGKWVLRIAFRSGSLLAPELPSIHTRAGRLKTFVRATRISEVTKTKFTRGPEEKQFTDR